MEIFFKCNEMGKMEVKVKGYKNDITGLEDLSWSISIIVSKMLNQIFEDAPTANKKEVADIILDKSKDTIYRFYNELEKDEKEADLYDAMEQVFENAIKEFGIDEKRMLKVAQTIKPNFVVEDGGDLYYCNVVFEDEIFTLGTVPKNLTEQGLYKEALKATIAATVLFDRAFPDDENKNPLRSNYTSDLYHDLINQLQTS